MLDILLTVRETDPSITINNNSSLWFIYDKLIIYLMNLHGMSGRYCC